MLKIYTDGSYTKLYPMVCGASSIIVWEENLDHYIVDIVYGVSTDLKYTKSNNIGGEILAVEEALHRIREMNRYDDIMIFHDYSGLGMWPDNKWQTTKPLTLDYAKTINMYRESQKIEFTHVYGHSGNVLNEYADAYAKRAIQDFIDHKDHRKILKNMRISKRNI